MPDAPETFLVFCRPNGGRVKITAPVLQLLRAYAQHGPKDTEAGGVMMGRYLQGSDDVVVDAATEPMRGDRRSRYSFYRDKTRHQAVLDAAWKTSGGTCTYLGEWHTHPEADPTPSGIDTHDWRRRLWTDKYDDELFFVIVGTAIIRNWSGKGEYLGSHPLALLASSL